MYVLSWRTVYTLTRLLFWCLFPSLLSNSGAHRQFAILVHTLFYINDRVIMTGLFIVIITIVIIIIISTLSLSLWLISSSFWTYIYIQTLHATTNHMIYREISNISGTEFQNLNVSRLLSQLSLCNIVKPGVKTTMKTKLEQWRQAMLQLHLSDQQFYCLVRRDLYYRFYGIQDIHISASMVRLTI